MGKRSIFIAIGLLILINILGFVYYFRLDLTEDKRYSISKGTQNLLTNLEAPVEITVYLEGDNLPAGFERLRRAVKETLVEFKYYGGRNISYKFVNPELGSDEEKKKLYQSFQQFGVVPTNIFDQKGGRKSEISLFPYAKISSIGREDMILLLKSNQISSVSPEEKLNQSYENVEYELASSIQKLSDTEKKNIGFLPEFTSRSPLEFRGMIDALKDRYNFYIIDTKASKSFEGLDALILASPDKKVDDSTKFKIDQFIMSGGKAMFFVDGLHVDSVGLEGSFAQPLDVNLDDMFFNYGLRINKNIIKDGLNAAVIPMVVGKMGDESNIQPVVYRYFPLINNFGNSLITKNIGMVLTKFAASIDTVNVGDGLKKTPLLLTSEHTKVLNAPALITYNEARKETEKGEYKSGVKAVAYLVEGKFKSIFQSNFSNRKILTESEPTKILVVSAGNVIRNETNPAKGTFYPLGYDKYFKHQYGNEDFLLNAVSYLVDGDGILKSKSKTINIRPLNTLKIKDERTRLQLVNIVAPIVILLLIGLLRYLWIKKKYGAN